MIFGNKCWVDVEAMDKDKVVVLPLGSFEQHGHHSPLFTDTYLVSAVAERVEAKLANQVYLLPTLWLGASDHHLDLPGTISIPNSLYTEVIKNMIRSIAMAGFQRVFLLNGHGGNVTPGTQAITELVNESDRYNEMWLALSSYWTLASPVMSADQHGMESLQLSHAGEYETSMMLYLKGELMRMDRVTSSPPLVDSTYYHSEHLGRVNVAKRMATSTPTGAMGKPQAATAEKGQSLLTAICEEVVNFLTEFAQW